MNPWLVSNLIYKPDWPSIHGNLPASTSLTLGLTGPCGADEQIKVKWPSSVIPKFTSYLEQKQNSKLRPIPGMWCSRWGLLVCRPDDPGLISGIHVKVDGKSWLHKDTYLHTHTRHDACLHKHTTHAIFHPTYISEFQAGFIYGLFLHSEGL